MRRGAPDWWPILIMIFGSLVVVGWLALTMTFPRKRGRPPIVRDDSTVLGIEVSFAAAIVLFGLSVVVYQVLEDKIPIERDPLHPGISSRSTPGLFWFAIVVQFLAVLTFGSMMLYTFLA